MLCHKVTLVYVRNSASLRMINLDLGMFIIQTSNKVIPFTLIYQYVVLPRYFFFFLCWVAACFCWGVGKGPETSRYCGGSRVWFYSTCWNIWSPYALKLINIITDHTIARSGSSTRLARRNLLLQLSVSLWTSKAKQSWSLDIPFPPAWLLQVPQSFHYMAICTTWIFKYSQIFINEAFWTVFSRKNDRPPTYYYENLETGI